MPEKTQNLNKYFKIIKKDYPKLEIKTAKFLKAGYDNFVIEINKSLIFRFPKNRRIILNKEIGILKLLKNKITLKIPDYEYLGITEQYVGYKKIFGRPLSSTLYKSLSLRQKNQLAKDLALFFYEFQLALPLKLSHKLGLKKDTQIWRLEYLKKCLTTKKINNEISLFLNRVIKKRGELKKKDFNFVVAYNDLHGNNIAFDTKTNRITGIFDFSDTAIEDVNQEFASIFSLDPKFVEKIIEEYEKISKIKVNLEWVFINSVIITATIFCDSLSKPKSANYRKSVNNLIMLNKISSQYLQ